MRKILVSFSFVCLVGMFACNKNAIEDPGRESNDVNKLSSSGELNLDQVKGNYILRPSKSDKRSIDALSAKVASLKTTKGGTAASSASRLRNSRNSSKSCVS